MRWRGEPTASELRGMCKARRGVERGYRVTVTSRGVYRGRRGAWQCARGEDRGVCCVDNSKVVAFAMRRVAGVRGGRGGAFR